MHSTQPNFSILFYYIKKSTFKIWVARIKLLATMSMISWILGNPFLSLICPQCCQSWITKSSVFPIYVMLEYCSTSIAAI